NALRHAVLVLEALLRHLERHREIKDRPPMLDGQYVPGAEAAAVAGAVDLIDDGRMGIAGAQKVGVQRMRLPFRVNGPGGGHQALPEHLAAEQLAEAEVVADAAEDVLFDLLQLEQLQKLGETCHLWHSSFNRSNHTGRPLRQCSTGLFCQQRAPNGTTRCRCIRIGPAACPRRSGLLCCSPRRLSRVGEPCADPSSATMPSSAPTGA